MKLKDAVFWGFTTKELEKVRKVKGQGGGRSGLF